VGVTVAVNWRTTALPDYKEIRWGGSFAFDRDAVNGVFLAEALNLVDSFRPRRLGIGVIPRAWVPCRETKPSQRRVLASRRNCVEPRHGAAGFSQRLREDCIHHFCAICSGGAPNAAANAVEKP